MSQKSKINPAKRGASSKIHFGLMAALIGIISFGGIGSGILVSRVSAELQASVIGNLQTSKKHKIVSKMIAQLVVPETVLSPLTVCLSTPVEKPEYKGEFITQENSVYADEGGEFEVSLYIKNTGNTSWFGDTSGCPSTNYMRLGTARESDHASIFYNPGDPRWLTNNRIAMLEDRVNPGEVATFRWLSRTPTVSDVFREYFRPVVEGQLWLPGAEALARVDIFVGEDTTQYEKALHYLGSSGQASALDVSGVPTVEVDISDQKARVKLGETVVREYTVSTGTFKTPTPIGRFKILNKQDLRIGAASPHYRMPNWQGFTKWGHGFHSLPYLANDRGTFWTEALSHIGQRVSHGCVRLLPEDSADLYNLIEVGTEVIIHA